MKTFVSEIGGRGDVIEAVFVVASLLRCFVASLLRCVVASLRR